VLTTLPPDPDELVRECRVQTRMVTPSSAENRKVNLYDHVLTTTQTDPLVGECRVATRVLTPRAKIRKMNLYYHDLTTTPTDPDELADERQLLAPSSAEDAGNLNLYYQVSTTGSMNEIRLSAPGSSATERHLNLF
jgi:hypothetical protein